MRQFLIIYSSFLNPKMTQSGSFATASRRAKLPLKR